MALRDVELKAAEVLEAASLGNTSSNPPTLYAGRFPVTAPDECMAVLFSGGENPTDYVGTTQALYAPEVSVLVRGARNDYAGARVRAVAAWEALYNATVTGYVWIRPLGSGPVSLGPDENSRDRFSFTARLQYSETP